MSLFAFGFTADKEKNQAPAAVTVDDGTDDDEESADEDLDVEPKKQPGKREAPRKVTQNHLKAFPWRMV